MSAGKILQAPERPGVRLWGGFHLPSVGLAVGGAALVAHFVRSPVAWPLVGFVATLIYLAVLAAQFMIAEAR